MADGRILDFLRQVGTNIQTRRNQRGLATPWLDDRLGPAQPQPSATPPAPRPSPAASSPPAGSAAAPPAGAPPAAGGAYTVQSGDNLWNIAARLLGNGNLWRQIAEINQLANPDRIQPGMQLRLPVTPAAGGDTPPLPSPNPERTAPRGPTAPVRTNWGINVPTIGPATVGAPQPFQTGVPAPSMAGPPLLAEGAAPGPQPHGPLIVPTSPANLSAIGGMDPIAGLTRTPGWYGGGVPTLPEGADGGRMVPTSSTPLAQSIFASGVPEMPMSPYPMFTPYGRRPMPRAYPPMLPGLQADNPTSPDQLEMPDFSGMTPEQIAEVLYRPMNYRGSWMPLGEALKLQQYLRGLGLGAPLEGRDFT